eukprot:CAMPEP_0116937226 /NCGR_PEP_ID=MMETSP0467-20121206/31368_1 /TAXON_ID=283647 /ORGANISM="Mesodinium pulex, Strain SPMC105" /LENGTH=103 /DNA_ID=CAMNT_0004618981 /DNA_START=188 /DNA_END=499 /DNA_ORIENTATION=+
MEFSSKIVFEEEVKDQKKKGKGAKEEKKEDISEEEIARLKEFNAKEEEIWATLSESEKRYRRAENPTKASKLKPKEGNMVAELMGEEIVKLEDLVFDGGKLNV